jgi:outer membrane receptor protein involved in Fe transport
MQLSIKPLLLPLFIASVSLRAQTADAPVRLEPLRVTADLWESPLSRLPASVTVLDEQTLTANAARHFGDVVNQVPNLTWTGGTSRPRYLQIRGIGENSQYEGETPDSAVRFLVDDFDFTGLGTAATLFDVKQVEVLRGPQAGAFGANAAGGLVRLVSVAPTSVWSGQIQGSLGGDDLREGGFAVGGPLIATRPEELMIRLAVQKHESDGFRHNVTLNQDTNAQDEFSTRLRVTWNPSPAWKWEAAGFYSDVDDGFDEFALNNNGRLTYSDQPGRDEQRSKAVSLRGTFSGWNAARVTTITSGTWTKSLYSYDDDWTAASYAGFSELHRDRDVFNEEVRLDSVETRQALGVIDRWTLGGFFSRLTEKSGYTDEDPYDLRGLATRYTSENSALFGQAARDLTTHTRIIVGLRAERIEIDGRGIKTRFRKMAGTNDPAVVFRPSFDDTLFGGKITLEQDLSAHQVAFASVTRGYKGGGINVDARISPPADPLTYATEDLWNYEVGVRGSWIDQRLTGEFTVFYLLRSHTQVRDSAGFGGSYRFFTANGNDADVHGLEASAAFAVTKAWSLHGSLAQLGSQLDRFTLTNGNSGGGRELANAPHYGYTLGARYQTSNGLFATADWQGRGRQFDSNNQNEARRPFQVVNATLGFAWNEWTVTVWARNLFDKRYEKRVFFFGNEDPDYVETRYEDRADPRQIGVTARYRF